MLSWWECGVRTETADGISFPKWHVLVTSSPQTWHQPRPCVASGASVHFTTPRFWTTRIQSSFPQQTPFPLTGLLISTRPFGPYQTISNPLPQEVPSRVFSADLKQVPEPRAQPSGNTLHLFLPEALRVERVTFKSSPMRGSPWLLTPSHLLQRQRARISLAWTENRITMNNSKQVKSSHEDQSNEPHFRKPQTGRRENGEPGQFW